MTGAPTLPLRVSLCWSTAGFAVACYIGITINFMLYFLTEAQGITPAAAGVALLIPRLWDVVTDPLMGAVSDRTRSRWGRRRPYVLFGGIAFGLFFALMFAVPEFESATHRLVYITVLYVLVSTAYTVFEVPLVAMSAEMTDGFHERTALVGNYITVIRIGLIFVAVAGPVLFSIPQRLDDGFLLLGVISGALMAASALIAFAGTGDAPQSPVSTVPLRPLQELRAIWRNRPFMILFQAYFLQNLAIGAQATTLIYFLVFVFDAPQASVGLFVSTVTVTAALFTPVWVLIARRMGKRNAYALGIVIAAVVQLAIYFVEPARLTMPLGLALNETALTLGMIVLALMMSIGAVGDSAMVMLPHALVPDTVEADELATGVRREGAIMGALNFCRKLGMTLGAFVVSLGLAYFGFESGAEHQSGEAVRGLTLTYTILPAVLYLLSAALLARYDLTEYRFSEIQRALRASRGAPMPAEGGS